jgi:hypothetical protein
MESHKPMPYKLRITYLVTTVIIFVLLVPVLIFYSQGYRLGDGFSFVKTGGVYISGTQFGAELYIDQKLVETNNRFQKDFFIQDVKPGMHLIAVAKDGHYSWGKNLVVAQEKVSVGHSFLTPRDVEEVNVEKFFDTFENNELVGRLRNSEYERLMTSFSPLASTTSVVRKKVSLTPEENAITVTWTGDVGEEPEFFCSDFDTCQSQHVLRFHAPIVQVDFLTDSVIVVALTDGLYIAEVDNRSDFNIHPLSKSEGIRFAIENESEILFTRNGELYKLEL